MVIEITREEAQDILEILTGETENPSVPHSKTFCDCVMCKMREKLKEKLRENQK